MTQAERIEKLFEDFREAIMKEFGMVEPVKRFHAPSRDNILDYFVKHGYRADVADKAWMYYSQAGWKDSNGKQIKNWKQKMVGVWFKDENKAPVIKQQDPTNVW